MRTRSAAVIRGLGAVHLVGGGCLVVLPRRLISAVGGARHAHGAAPPAWIVRVLGLRYVGQGIVELAKPDGDTALVGAATDLTHAASMLPAALLWRRYRRYAVISACVAGAGAAVDGYVAAGGR